MWRLFPKRWEVSNKCIPWNLRKYKCNSKPRCLEKRDYYGKNNKKYFRRNHNIRTEKSFWSDLCFNRIKVRGHKTYGFEYMDCSFLRFHKFLLINCLLYCEGNPSPPSRRNCLTGIVEKYSSLLDIASLLFYYNLVVIQ